MKYTTVIAAVALAAQSVVGLMINTPMSVVECQPLMLSWAGDAGTPPYYLSIIPGGQPNGAPLKIFQATNDTTVTWKVDIQANTQITVSLKDNTGAQAYTDQVTVQTGGDRSCESTNTTATFASGNASPPPATTANAAPSASGSASASASASGSAHPSGSQAAVASAKPTKNAAVAAVDFTSQIITGGVAGLFVAVGALML